MSMCRIVRTCSRINRRRRRKSTTERGCYDHRMRRAALVAVVGSGIAAFFACTSDYSAEPTDAGAEPDVVVEAEPSSDAGDVAVDAPDANLTYCSRLVPPAA